MLIILAGVTIHAIVGDNGIINKTRKAAEDTERAKVQEELEMIITELEMGALMEKRDLTVDDIKDALSKLKDITIEDPIGNIVEGEYKNFGFIINDKIVTVNEMISGEKPTGLAINLNSLNNIEVAETVEVQVTGKTESGSISKIEALETEGITFNENDVRNSNERKIYIVSQNGTYHFRITGSTGRSYIETIIIENAAPLKKDLLTGIADINSSGFKMIKVNGKTKEDNPLKDDKEDKVTYKLNVIYCDGDLILKNGSYTHVISETGEKTEAPKPLENLKLGTDNVTWSLGNADDVNTNMVVLKVNGNLTLENGFKLTSVKNGTDIAKGLFVYCTGDLTIDGTVELTGVTCKATRTKCILMEEY